MYRLIQALLLTFDRDERGASQGVYIRHDRAGQPAVRGGIPVIPLTKDRIVDLRVGDPLRIGGKQHRVIALKVFAENVLTDEQAAAWRQRGSTEGWLVKCADDYQASLRNGQGG